MMRKNFTFLGSMVLGLLCFSQALFAQTNTVTFSSTGAAVGIVDNAYDGSLGSMAQKTTAVSGIPASNVTIDAITIDMNASHTWIGDLAIKLIAPDGSVFGVMSRPGLADVGDNGLDCCGASDDLTGATITFADAATTSSENMGLATATTVGSDGVFSFSPSKGSMVSPYTSFASMATTLGSAGLNGNWTLAIGDAGGGDVGTFTGFSINITYTVNIPCVLTCPSNVTLNLAGGECGQAYSYAVNYSGNCNVLVQAPASVTQNVNTTQIDDALDCSAFTPTSQWRAYSNPTQFTINSVTTASFFGSTVQAFVYTYTGAVGAATLNTAQMTLVGQSNATVVGGQSFTTLNLVAPAVIPAGTNYVVELRRTAAGGFAVAGNYLGETAPSYITCPTAGITTPTSYGSLGFGFIHVIQIVNGTTAQSVPPTLVQTSGLASGEEFPIGTTTNCFELRNPVTGAVVQSCCFNVVVNEYANPITSLICNDHVNISLDENCTTTIGADQILEGGPYGCYDDYIVELDKSAPFGNGPWLPSTVGAGDVGKTYQVRVTDPTTGNKCWGTVKIEDKFAPVLSCPTVTIPCNYPSTPGAVSSLAPVSFASSSISIIDVGTATASIPVNVGAAPVLKVTVGISSTHTWVGDLSMTVTNPSGTQTVVFDRPGGGGCAGNGLEVTFDDGAANTYAQFNGTCGNNPAIAGTFQSLGGLAQLNSGNLNGNWSVSITDAVGGDTGNATVTITLVTAAPIPFPNGVAAIPTGATSYIVPAGTGTPVMEYCSDVTLSYIDSEAERDCASGLTKVISRKWTARDASGNTTVCTQTINVLRPQLSDISLPPDYDGIDAPAFTCGSAYPTPSWIQGQGLQGFPEIWGVPSGCSINWEYDDQVLDVCDGTYKIRRDWTIIDWCTGTGFEATQLIKVLDEVGPSIECPANLTVSVDPFNCCATVDLPDAIIADECSRINNISAMVTTFDPQTGAQTAMYVVGGSLTTFPGNNLWTPDTLGRYGVTTCLPMGTHTVVYMAEDDCGNTSTCSFRLTVRDWVPPSVVATQATTVAVGVDDPSDCYGPAGPFNTPPALGSCEGAGVTWVKASAFDQGSTDNCGNLRFTARRMAPYSDCINALNQSNSSPACDDLFPDFISEFQIAVEERDSIKFYCCEVGTTQTILFRAYQVDLDGNFMPGQDGLPLFGEVMIQVEVQDKIKPVCIPPANVTVNCEAFDPSLWAYGKPTVADNCCLDTSRVYQGQCGLTHSASYTQFDTVCNRGTITRTFRAFDCHGFSSQCTQRVVVTYRQDYWVRFPNDVIVTVCDGSGTYGEPTFFGENCELLATSYTDELFTVVPDACFKIERTWKVINWCTYDPNQGCIAVPNPNPNAITNSPQNLPGPIVSPVGTPAPWAPTVVSITPGAPATNYGAAYWNANFANNNLNVNCYTYKQIIKVIDTQAPTAQCPASPVEFCDLTPNNGGLWNEMYYWDNLTESHDLCEGPSDLTLTATDACSGANINIEYLLFLDLDGNGSMETVVSSVNLPGFNRVNYNNAGNPNFSGGTAYAFDERPVPGNQKYGFAIQKVKQGNNLIANVRWNTAQSPTNYVIPELPYGTHKIKWFITDGCGNNRECEYTFVVKDCKKPTVVCLNGLSVNIMQTGMVSLWASDFLQYTEDNCTPTDKLKIGIVRSEQSTGSFPVDGNGNPLTEVQFTCADTDIEPELVQLWSIDLAGNADFCETYVLVQDNMGNCGGPKPTVAGYLKTEGQQGVEDAQVDLTGSSPAVPSISMFQNTLETGKYEFSNAVPVASNLTITPVEDDNHINGVSTFDLVLISKHILGIEPLTSPYKMIAADANKSGSITTFDIVELRKLILGVYTELPNNTSWRFVDKAYSFPNPSNPFANVFPENKSIASLNGNMTSEDFTSIKIGDLNGNAVANSLMQSEDRAAGTLVFDVQDRAVKAGETFDVTFKAAEQVQGYQFTMNFAGLDVVDVTGLKAENYAVFAADKAMTTSVNGEGNEFTVRFRATQAGELSKLLGVSSRITKAEAYNAGSDRLDVAFRFNGANGSVVSGVGFELYQNVPNPFVSKTTIGFNLPEATTATLTIFDETGRMLWQQKGDFAKGYNQIAVDRALLNTTGMMYYQLETQTESATRKMIQTK